MLPFASVVAEDCDESTDVVAAGATDCICGSVFTLGGDCGAGRSVPGVAVGLDEFGRACSGTDCRRSVPGGRVASCCAGLGVVGVCARTATQMMNDNAIV